MHQSTSPPVLHISCPQSTFALAPKLFKNLKAQPRQGTEVETEAEVEAEAEAERADQPAPQQQGRTARREPRTPQCTGQYE